MDPLFQPLLHGLDILREFIDPRLAKWANAQVLPNRVLFQLAHHKKFDGMVVNPITNLPCQGSLRFLERLHSFWRFSYELVHSQRKTFQALAT